MRSIHPDRALAKAGLLTRRHANSGARHGLINLTSIVILLFQQGFQGRGYQFWGKKTESVIQTQVPRA